MSEEITGISTATLTNEETYLLRKQVKFVNEIIVIV